jgi:hypothetical protein
VLMVCLAGMRAERSHVSWDDSLEALWERSPDWEVVEDRIGFLGLSRSDESALRAEMVERVDEILDRHWRKLDAVARALSSTDGRILSGEKLAALLGDTPTNNGRN